MGDRDHEQEQREDDAKGHRVQKCNEGAERRFADFRDGVRNGFAGLGVPLPSGIVGRRSHARGRRALINRD